MSDGKIVDFAHHRELRDELAREEKAAWAGALEERALRLYTKHEREMFTGFCTVVFDKKKSRWCVLLGPHGETRVVARYNIGKNDSLRPVTPTKRDDELLARLRAGVYY